jgi:AcrR family transcriptional regulator
MSRQQTTRRARSDAAKHERRDAILDAALALWGEQTFGSFAMSDLAARSGLAKGTLYLYFATKEELFLALLERELVAWFDTLDAALTAHDAWDAPRVGALLSETLDARAALTRLLPIAASVLEHNIPLAAARSYKEVLLDRSTRSGALLERRLGFLAPGDGTWVLLQVYALVVGLGQMSDPSPLVCGLLEDPSLAPLRVTFGPAFRRAATSLLRGMAQEHTGA